MISYNKVILLGHLGNDPIIRNLDGELKLAELSLATHETLRKNGQEQEITHWHEVVAWRKLADFSEKNLVRGRKVLVEGKLRTSSFEDKTTGKKKKNVFIQAESILIIEKKDPLAIGLDPQVGPGISTSPDLEIEELPVLSEEKKEKKLMKKTAKIQEPNPIDPEIGESKMIQDFSPEWTQF